MSTLTPKWKTWLSKNGYKHALPMLTGQDFRALGAIAACWELCAISDRDGERAAIESVRALLPAMQKQCRYLAVAVIPYAADWGHVNKWWPQVVRLSSHDPVAIECRGFDPQVQCGKHGIARWQCDVSHEAAP